MFRAILLKLERLIDVWTKQDTDLIPNSHVYSHSHSEATTSPIGEAMTHTLKLLIDFDINTSESNAIEELEHLVTIKTKTLGIPTVNWGPIFENYCESKDPRIKTRTSLEYLTESKIAFLKGGTFSRLVSEGGVKPMTAFERLTEVQLKLRSNELSKLLVSKMNEIFYTCEAKASAKIIPIIWEQLHSYTAAIDPIRHYLFSQCGGFHSCRSILFCTLNASSLIVHPRLLRSARGLITTYLASAKSERQLNPCHTHHQDLEIKTTSTCNGS